MGRETFLSSPEVGVDSQDPVRADPSPMQLREKCEDDIRAFAERSDHTEVCTSRYGYEKRR